MSCLPGVDESVSMLRKAHEALHSTISIKRQRQGNKHKDESDEQEILTITTGPYIFDLHSPSSSGPFDHCATTTDTAIRLKYRGISQVRALRPLRSLCMCGRRAVVGAIA